MGAYSKNPKRESLLELSEEVSRIAGTLAHLSAAAYPEGSRGKIPRVSEATVDAVIRARRLRKRYFSDDLFADPAWDMMLDLFHAELCHRRVSVSSLCLAAAVPATTALRWLKSMVDQGLFIRRDDQLDGRRVFVELAPETSLAMQRYFADLDHPTVI